MKSSGNTRSQSRRRFLGTVGAAAAATVAIGATPFAGDNGSRASAAVADGLSSGPDRMNDCFNYRMKAAIAGRVNGGVQSDNGDRTRFTDFSGNFSKTLQHDALGVANAAAMQSLRGALASGDPAAFAAIGVGTPGGGDNSKLNCPQMSLAFDLEGLDSHATVIPAAPSVASAQTAAEQAEHYWAALLADVPFTEYGTDPLVGQAVSNLNNMSFFAGGANDQCPYPITLQNLFRGQIVPGDGNVKGPYISQFMIQPTYYGAQPLDRDL